MQVDVNGTVFDASTNDVNIRFRRGGRSFVITLSRNGIRFSLEGENKAEAFTFYEFCQFMFDLPDTTKGDADGVQRESQETKLA